jgi:hypothetical protein
MSILCKKIPSVLLSFVCSLFAQTALSRKNGNETKGPPISEPKVVDKVAKRQMINLDPINELLLHLE